MEFEYEDGMMEGLGDSGSTEDETTTTKTYTEVPGGWRKDPKKGDKWAVVEKYEVEDVSRSRVLVDGSPVGGWEEDDDSYTYTDSDITYYEMMGEDKITTGAGTFNVIKIKKTTQYDDEEYDLEYNTKDGMLVKSESIDADGKVQASLVLTEYKFGGKSGGGEDDGFFSSPVVVGGIIGAVVVILILLIVIVVIIVIVKSKKKQEDIPPPQQQGTPPPPPAGSVPPPPPPGFGQQRDAYGQQQSDPYAQNQQDHYSGQQADPYAPQQQDYYGGQQADPYAPQQQDHYGDGQQQDPYPAPPPPGQQQQDYYGGRQQQDYYGGQQQQDTYPAPPPPGQQQQQQWGRQPPQQGY
jgi:hypothetical protein